MAYGIIRIQKIKVSDGGGLSKRIDHALRLHVSDNVDKTRVKLDEFHGAATRKDIFQKIRERQALATTRRKDGVGVLEVVATTTGPRESGTEEEFLAAIEKQLNELYGAENVIGWYVHRDEKEVHVHSFVVPLETKKVEKTRLTVEEEEKLQKKLEEKKIKWQAVPKKPGKDADEKAWKKYKADKKAYEKYKADIKPILEELGISKTETLLTCQKYCDGKAAMSALQDLWFKNVFEQFGLERGERNSGKKYSPTKLHKWQQQLDEKEADLKQREKDLKQREKDELKDLEQKKTNLGFEIAGLQGKIKKLETEETKLRQQAAEQACREAVEKYAELSGEKSGDVRKLIDALPAEEGQTAAEYQAKVLPYLQTYKEGVDRYLEKKEASLQTDFNKKVEAFEKEKQTARDTMAAAIERVGQADYQTVKNQLNWWLRATPEQLEEKAADRRRKLRDSQEQENGRQRLSNTSGPKR